jgi:hypothetical protein
MDRRIHTRHLFDSVIDDASLLDNLTVGLVPQEASSNINTTTNSTMSPDDTNNFTIFHNVASTAVTIVCSLCLLAMCACLTSNHSPEAQRLIRRYKKGKPNDPRNNRVKRIRQSLTVQQVVLVETSGHVQLEDVQSFDDLSRNENISKSIVALEGDGEDLSSIVSKSSSTDSDNLVACCCICLEPYRVGDIVAWSKNSTENCLHVFHKDCIYLWLENPKHDDCPSCRSSILQPIPSDTSSVDSDDEDDIEQQRRGRNTDNNADNADDTLDNLNCSASVAYYIIHGLISRANQVKFTLIGQTISFDSDDSDVDGIQQTSNILNDFEPRALWMTNPSSLRRAMSFTDRIFSNKLATPFKRHSLEWKAIASGETNGGNFRRASTKVIKDFKMLQPAHDLRRVVSAGPCTPFDDRRNSVKHGRLHSVLFHDSDQVITPKTLDQYMDNTAPIKLLVPLRRASSLRRRVSYQSTLMDCHEEDEHRIEYNNLDSLQLDPNEEDEIVIQRET